MLSHSDKTKVTMSLLLIAIVGSTALAGTQIQQAFAAVNGLPTVNQIPDQTVDELQLLTFTVTASDPDGQQLAFSLQNAPYGASINSTTGAFTWTPTEEQGSGVYHINVIVSDGMVISSGTVMIIVNDVGGGGHGGGGGGLSTGPSIISEPDLGSAVIGSTNTKVRAFQNDLQIDSVNPGQINTDTDCVGGIDSIAGATYMICYLIPPGVSNNDNSNAIAQITQPIEETECPADVGFNVAEQTCYRAEFAGALFDQQGDWHFHAEFYNAQDQLISDGRQTFANNSFFVLPESPIGVAALVVSSLAVLGGFMFLRGRSHSNLPL